MKREEREHLKEDLLVSFVEKNLKRMSRYKKPILTGIISFFALVILLTVISLLSSQSIKAENEVYTQAVIIRNSVKLTIDRKIEKLLDLERKSGLSSAVRVFIASAYFEKGEIDKAEEILNKSEDSKYRIINNQKNLLLGEILSAKNKKKEALFQFNKLFSNTRTEIPRDFLLIKIAKLQIETDQKNKAKASLNDLVNTYRQSYYYAQARKLLDTLE